MSRITKKQVTDLENKLAAAERHSKWLTEENAELQKSMLALREELRTTDRANDDLRRVIQEIKNEWNQWIEIDKEYEQGDAGQIGVVKLPAQALSELIRVLNQ